jgi:hypothetical protein
MIQNIVIITSNFSQQKEKGMMFMMIGLMKNRENIFMNIKKLIHKNHFMIFKKNVKQMKNFVQKLNLGLEHKMKFVAQYKYIT